MKLFDIIFNLLLYAIKAFDIFTNTFLQNNGFPRKKEFVIFVTYVIALESLICIHCYINMLLLTYSLSAQFYFDLIISKVLSFQM